MGMKVDVAPQNLRTLQALLKQYLPHTRVWAFGSRVKFTAHPASDLDVVAFISKEQEIQFSLLKEALEESDLPFRVDLHDWNELPETFYENIKSNYVEIQSDKKTELAGDWKTYKLGDIIELKRGYDLPDYNRVMGNVPVFTSSGFSSLHNIAKVAGPGVITGRYGTLGEVYYVEKDYWPHNTTLYVRNFNGNDPKFIYYYLKTLRLASGNDKSSVPGLNRNDLHRFDVFIPNLPTQIQIAQILSSLDDKIELNLKMNQTLEDMAQAIFKEWFVDFNFPGFNDELIDGLPKGWSREPIDAKIIFLNGLALQKFPPLNNADFLPVIKIRELKQGFTNASDKASTLLPEKYVICDGDVLFSWSGSLEVVLWCEGKGALNQHLFKVSSNDYPKWFYFFWVREYLPLYKSIAEGKATTMGHIQRKHLTDSIINVPDVELMDLANNILSPLLNRIQKNKIQSQSLTQIRDTLLPKLMSGQVEIV